MLGVLVTGAFAIIVAERQAKRAGDERRRDRLEQREEADAKSAEAAAFQALAVARHLEAYARECADLAVDQYLTDGGFPKRPPELKAFNAIAWERLGAVATAEAMDLVQRHRLRRGYIVGDAEESGGDADERMGIYRDGAARLGLDAWETAVVLRSRAGLPAFDFPDDGWNFVGTLRERIAAADERASTRDQSGL